MTSSDHKKSVKNYEKFNRLPKINNGILKKNIKNMQLRICLLNNNQNLNHCKRRNYY